MPTPGSEVQRALSGSLFKTKAEYRKLSGEIATIIDLLVMGNISEATDKVIEFLGGLWREFSVTSHGEMFLDFAKTEKALYGLELTEEGGRYRDHLIHLFNVFVTGLLIISEMMKVNEPLTFSCFKITPEYSRMPFPIRYKSSRRLYHLWALVSTLHDIALPVEHLRKLTEGLREFYRHFEISTPGLEIRFPPMSSVRAGQYFRMEDRMFNSGILLSDDPEAPSYRLDNMKEYSPYFSRTLFDLFEARNHGVVASYYLYDSMERTFLRRRHEELFYDLDVTCVSYRNKTIPLPPDKKKWPSILKHKIPRALWNGPQVSRTYDPDRKESLIYMQYVLEQDITRAALAIALHSISTGEHPKLFPISISKLPISWFLVLLDETQEYFRPEGLWLHSVTRFQDFPKIIVKQSRSRRSFNITMILNFKRPTEADEKMMVSKYNLWKERDRDVQSYEELVIQTWTGVFKRLRNKILFEEEAPMAVSIRITVEGRSPGDQALEFVSSNW
jgi:hypothetical protein